MPVYIRIGFILLAAACLLVTIFMMTNAEPFIFSMIFALFTFLFSSVAFLTPLNHA